MKGKSASKQVMVRCDGKRWLCLVKRYQFLDIRLEFIQKKS